MERILGYYRPNVTSQLAVIGFSDRFYLKIELCE
jgi:hypothetical protein